MDAPLRPLDPVTIIPYVIGVDEIRRVQGEIQNALRCPVDLEEMETPVIQSPCGHPISAVAMSEQYKTVFPPGKVSVVAPKGTKCPTCRNELARYAKDDDLLAIVKVINSFLNNLLSRAINGDRHKLDVTEISNLCQSIIKASLLSCGHLIGFEELADNLDDKTRTAICRQCRLKSELLGPNYSTKAIAELVLELFAPLDKRCARAADKYDAKTSNAKSLDALFKMFSSLPADSEAWQSLRVLFDKFLEIGDPDKIASFLTRAKKVDDGKHLPELTKALKAKVRKLKGDQKIRFEKVLAEYLAQKDPKQLILRMEQLRNNGATEADSERLFTDLLEAGDFLSAQEVIQYRRNTRTGKAKGATTPEAAFGKLITKFMLSRTEIPLLRKCMEFVSQQGMKAEEAQKHYIELLSKSVERLTNENLSVFKADGLAYIQLLDAIGRTEDNFLERMSTFFEYLIRGKRILEFDPSVRNNLLETLLHNYAMLRQLALPLLECRDYLLGDFLKKCSPAQTRHTAHWLFICGREVRNTEENEAFFDALNRSIRTPWMPETELQNICIAVLRDLNEQFFDRLEPFFVKLVSLDCRMNTTEGLDALNGYTKRAVALKYRVKNHCLQDCLLRLHGSSNFFNNSQENELAIFLRESLLIHHDSQVTYGEVLNAIRGAAEVLPHIDVSNHSQLIGDAMDAIIQKTCNLLARVEAYKVAKLFEEIHAMIKKVSHGNLLQMAYLTDIWNKKVKAVKSVHYDFALGLGNIVLK